VTTTAIDRRAVTRGWLAGLPWLVVAVVLQIALIAASDDPSDAWAVALLGLLLVGFGRAGAVTASQVQHRVLTHGAVAAGTLLLTWIPVRLAVALVGDSDRPLAGLGAAIAVAVLAGMTGAFFVRRKQGDSVD